MDHTRASRPSTLWGRLYLVTIAVGASFGLASNALSSAGAISMARVSEDPYTNSTSFQKTELEPDSFANGSTIAPVFRSGRFADGGSSNVGWATSTDGGATWKQGFRSDHATPGLRTAS
jgi:hypothetical protein